MVFFSWDGMQSGDNVMKAALMLSALRLASKGNRKRRRNSTNGSNNGLTKRSKRSNTPLSADNLPATAKLRIMSMLGKKNATRLASTSQSFRNVSKLNARNRVQKARRAITGARTAARTELVQAILAKLHRHVVQCAEHNPAQNNQRTRMWRSRPVRIGKSETYLVSVLLSDPSIQYRVMFYLMTKTTPGATHRACFLPAPVNLLKHGSRVEAEAVDASDDLEAAGMTPGRSQACRAFRDAVKEAVRLFAARHRR